MHFIIKKNKLPLPTITFLLQYYQDRWALIFDFNYRKYLAMQWEIFQQTSFIVRRQKFLFDWSICFALSFLKINVRFKKNAMSQ